MNQIIKSKLKQRMTLKKQQAALKFTFSSPFDKNGILWYIGTDKNTKSNWTNPGRNEGGNKVKVESSTLYSRSGAHVSDFISRSIKHYSATNNRPNSWVTFDLKKYKIKPNYYCVQHDDERGSYYLRNWELQGWDNKNNKWQCLSKHTNDQSLKQSSEKASWPIKLNIENNKYYSKFRMYSTGQTSSGDNYVVFSGIELYGLALEM